MVNLSKQQRMSTFRNRLLIYYYLGKYREILANLWNALSFFGIFVMLRIYIHKQTVFSRLSMFDSEWIPIDEWSGSAHHGLSNQKKPSWETFTLIISFLKFTFGKTLTFHKVSGSAFWFVCPTDMITTTMPFLLLDQLQPFIQTRKSYSAPSPPFSQRQQLTISTECCGPPKANQRGGYVCDVVRMFMRAVNRWLRIHRDKVEGVIHLGASKYTCPLVMCSSTERRWDSRLILLYVQYNRFSKSTCGTHSVVWLLRWHWKVLGFQIPSLYFLILSLDLINQDI